MLKPVYPFANVFPGVLKGLPMFWDDARAPAMRLDVEEDEKAYAVKAEIPGVKREDIFVDVEGAEVTIRAEVRRELPESDERNALLAERFYGVMTRTFTLPMPVDADATNARYEDGVLWLTLPKTAGAFGHRVPIS
jgi:HSP20 family protein